MDIMEALNILRNSLNEATLSWPEQERKMRALNNGTRGFNAAAASDEKLRFNREVCQTYNLGAALDVIELEMVKRGLLSQTTAQANFAKAQQAAQAAKQAQAAPTPKPRTEAEKFKDDFENLKDSCIPTKDDFEYLSKYKSDWNEEVYARTWTNSNLCTGIRHFLTAALVGNKVMQAAYQEQLKLRGFDSELIKQIVTYVLANKDKFKDFLAEFKAKTEGLEKLAEDIGEDFDPIQYVPQEKDFQKVCESMQAVAEDGLEYCSLKLNPNKVPGLLRTTSNGNPAPLIRRFIASSLLGWELLSNNLKAEIKKMQVSQDDITKIIKAVMAEKNLFVQNFLKYKPIFEEAKKKTESLTEAFDTDVDIILNKAIQDWNLTEALTEDANSIWSIPWTVSDFQTADAFFVKEHIDDPKTLIENCLAATGTIKHTFITLVFAAILGAPQATIDTIRSFLTVNCAMPGQECKNIIAAIMANSDIRSHLLEIRNEITNNVVSTQTNQTITSQPDPAQQTPPQPQANNNGTKNAGVTNMGVDPAKNFCRLIIYDVGYNPPARRHLYIGKKVGGVYQISVGGSQFGPSHSWYDEPLFENIVQATNFIHNVDQNHINTSVDTHNFKFNMTSKPIDLGIYQGQKRLIENLNDAVLVDTACGPAYIQRKNKKCVESLNLTEAKEENLEEKVREIIKGYLSEDKSRLGIIEYDNGYDGFVEEFGEDEDGHRDVIDFGVFTYNDLSDEDIEKGKPVITFLLSGGLNGSGDWKDYLSDISDLFKEFREKLDLHAIIYKLDTDICDDVWTAEVLLYIDRDTVKENLNEDLIVINERHAKEAIEELQSQIEKSTDWKVRKNLLTLMDVYLFQTIYESDHQEETGCDINKDEWEEYSKWHTEQGEKLAKEHPEVLEKEKEWEEEEIAAKENAESSSEEEREETKELRAKKESLTEGCWGMPYTLDGVNKLKNLMSKPVDAFEVGDHPTNKNDELGIGDDTLFDNIAKYRKEHGYGTEASDDVRKVIQDFIKDEVLPNWDGYSYSQPEGDYEGHTWENGVKEVFQEIADMDLSDKADEIRKNAKEHKADDFPPEEVAVEEDYSGNKLTFCYSGPVYHFEKRVTDKWEACTQAVSAAKALNNLTVRAKEQFGYLPSAKFTLDPKYLFEKEDKIDDKPVSCPKCGMRLTDSGECPVCDLGDESALEEDVEKHHKLNPKLFDNNKLKPEVREKLLEIVDEFSKNFADPEVAFIVKDIVLTGSNASYNYTKDSDIDLHIIADTSNLDDPNKLYPLIYDAYKSIFNSKMDISIYDIPVEIYVETEDTARVSNGVYSVKNDVWLQEPVETIIPEIDWDEFMKAFKPWEDKYKKLVKETEGEKTIDETPIDEFINKVYELRQQGLHNGGEYSFENLIFKELRNRGHLERLKDLRNRVIANRLSLKSLDEAYLDADHLFFDYNTAEIADDEYIDVKKGSNFAAQDLLDGSKDKAYKDLISTIALLTPKQYFAICSRIQHQPAEDLIKYVEEDQDKLEHLKQVIKDYNKKFPLPYANFAPNTEPEGQEGKHRMYVLGELFGWETPFPVQIIKEK